MKEKIYNELMSHVGICTHKEPQDVLILSSNGFGLVDAVAKYKTIDATVIEPTLEAIRDIEEKKYDVVIGDGISIDATITAHINRVMKEDGLCVVSGFDLEDEKTTTQKLQELGKYFKIAMPYNLFDGSYAVLASKEYHPTADINLQRADLTDGFEVYNSDLHVGIFALPTYLKKRYLGIIKN